MKLKKVVFLSALVSFSLLKGAESKLSNSPDFMENNHGRVGRVQFSLAPCLEDSPSTLLSFGTKGTASRSLTSVPVGTIFVPEKKKSSESTLKFPRVPNEANLAFADKREKPNNQITQKRHYKHGKDMRSKKRGKK